MRLKNIAAINPIANFCNICAALSAFNATSTYIQLPDEAQNRHWVGYLIILGLVLTIPFFTLCKKINLICLTTSTILNLTACYSLIFLGNTLIGYCLFFMCFIFNMFAFPKAHWKTRWGTLFFSIFTLAFGNFMITQKFLPWNQLTTTHSPFFLFGLDILAICSVIICLLFAQSIFADENKKATAATLAKSRFIANTSHELRTPLSAIIGFIDLLLDTNPTENERKKYLEVVKRSGNQLLEIVNDILDLSKIEADKLEIKKQVFELRPLLNDIGALMELKATKKGLQFSIHYRNSSPSQIYSDPLRLRQILVNLVGNAIKFTTEGEVKILVESIPSQNHNDLIQFDIVDTGPGIDKNYAKDLFEAFSQGANSLTQKIDGSGLGLSVSRELTELLGGKLELIDLPTNKGSIFRLSLPCKKAENPKKLAGDAQDTPPTPTPFKK